MDYENTLVEVLEELCPYLVRDAKDTIEKIRNAGGRMSSGDVEYLDKLTHAIKSVKTTLAMCDTGYSGENSGMSGAGMSGARRRSRRTGRYYSGDESMDGGSGDGMGMSNRSYHHGNPEMAQKLRQMADMMEQQGQ